MNAGDIQTGATRDWRGEYIPPPGGKPLTSLSHINPAPSDYSPNKDFTMPKAPKYTMRMKTKHAKQKNFNTSPGKYNVGRDLLWPDNTFPICRRDKTRPFADRDDVEITTGTGAGGYKVDKNSVGNCGPKWTMELKNDISSFQTPGPNFMPDSEMGQGYKATIGNGPKFECLTNSYPGPAKYKIRDKLTTVPMTMGKVIPQIIDALKFDFPGPGAHDLDSFMGKGPAVSFKDRHELKDKQNFPACNLYVFKGIHKVRAASIRFKPIEPTIEYSTPAPTTYTVTDAGLKRSPFHTIGDYTKPVFPDILQYPQIAQCDATPGPACYDNIEDDKFPHFDSPKHTMGMPCKPKISDVPGPSSYSVSDRFKSDVKKAPAFTIGMKRKTVDAVRPGPADYNVRQSLSRRGPSTMKGSRSNPLTVFPTPGPNVHVPKAQQTMKGTQKTPSISIRSRHSPYVFSGFKTNRVYDS